MTLDKSPHLGVYWRVGRGYVITKVAPRGFLWMKAPKVRPPIGPINFDLYVHNYSINPDWVISINPLKVSKWSTMLMAKYMREQVLKKK